eukprot:TRINITY_DN39624_c0_g1_i1.p1 TRINITY_DN39624_c0_g1~~TRINITY_DN39624_c0_g1_i1.p1  ORF type:complete len:157 (+),score=35.07 TRINITY_DN39624_c0_g1_i1:80-550(+)
MGANCGCEASKDAELKPTAEAPYNFQDEVLPSESKAAEAGMPGTKDDAKTEPEPSPGEEEQRRHFFITVKKEGDQDRLGMDVKHLPGLLEVVAIFPGCAVHRTNTVALSRTPPGETLIPGDLIHTINGVSGNDRKMVEQCRTQQVLEIAASRAMER